MPLDGLVGLSGALYSRGRPSYDMWEVIHEHIHEPTSLFNFHSFSSSAAFNLSPAFVDYSGAEAHQLRHFVSLES